MPLCETLNVRYSKTVTIATEVKPSWFMWHVVTPDATLKIQMN